MKPVSITAFGRTQTVAAWAQEYGLRKSTLISRLKLVDREGDLADVVSAPVGSRGRTDERDARWRPDGTGEMWPGARDTPYEDDSVAQAMMAGRGLFTLDEVAAFMGLTRERVRQIECSAVRKLLMANQRRGGG